MTARLVRRLGPHRDEATLLASLAAEGWTGGYGWSNRPGETYQEHSHGYAKALYCVRGSVVFRTAEGDVELRPGDRLELEPGTEHRAVVGPEGVRCVEAHRP